MKILSAEQNRVNTVYTRYDNGSYVYVRPTGQYFTCYDRGGSQPTSVTIYTQLQKYICCAFLRILGEGVENSASRSFLEDFDVEVNDSTEFKMGEAKSSTGETTNTICVTTEKDGLVTSDILMVYSENEDGSVTPVDSIKVKDGIASPMAGYSGSFTWNNIVMKATAVYNLYGSTIFYYQPVGCYFSYTRQNSTTVSVTSAKAQYVCRGGAFNGNGLYFYMTIAGTSYENSIAF